MSRSDLFVKGENFQTPASFKIRGASNAILSLSQEQAARGVVTQSSGNHAAAVACAGAWRRIPAWIVMPKNAPEVKRCAAESDGRKTTYFAPTVSPTEETAVSMRAVAG